mgnify:FL=1|jgi:hypothetical protein
MRWSLDELTDLYMAGQTAESKTVDHMGNPVSTAKPLSHDVMRCRVVSMYSGLNNFSMGKVVTGARRKWRR